MLCVYVSDTQHNKELTDRISPQVQCNINDFLCEFGVCSSTLSDYYFEQKRTKIKLGMALFFGLLSLCVVYPCVYVSVLFNFLIFCETTVNHLDVGRRNPYGNVKIVMNPYSSFCRDIFVSMKSTAENVIIIVILCRVCLVLDFFSMSARTFN